MPIPMFDTMLFYSAATVGVLATFMTITRANAIHALLYFIVSLFSTAFMFFLLGAPFVAALEVIVYAGAIMVLFVFVVMLIDITPDRMKDEKRLMAPRLWVGPSVLALALGIELVVALAGGAGADPTVARGVSPHLVGVTLMGPYALGVEIASMLLLAGLVGAYHIGRRERGTP